jgi:hypothetical protein
MNDKITNGARELGYCCPFAYLCARQGRHDRNKKLAKEVGVTEKAIEWNKKKWREGDLICANYTDCQHARKDR